MRNLTRKQKALLDEWHKEQKDNGRILGFFWKVDEDDNFSSELFEKIDEINPCEMVYQNINEYISEKEANFF